MYPFSLDDNYLLIYNPLSILPKKHSIKINLCEVNVIQY